MQTTGQAAVRKRRIFYGWWIVAAGAVIQMMNGALLFHGFGAYFVHLHAQFGWSRTMVSGAFSMARAESGILGPFQGWLIDKFGPRAVMQVGIVIFGLGFMLFSQIDSVLTFYLTFLIMAVGSSLGGFMAISTTVANWFARKRSMAFALTMSGFALGGLLVPGLAWSLNTFGWRPTAFASGVAIILIGIPVASLMRQAPEKYGYLPDGDPPHQQTEGGVSPAYATRVSNLGQAAIGFTVKEALKTPTFWFLSVGQAMALLAVSATMVHLIPHLVEKVGLSLEAAGGVVALLTAMSILGQLSGGYFGDRIEKRFGVAVCLLGHMVALLVLAYASTVTLVLVFAVIQGLAWGFRGPLGVAIRADYFGRAHFATILGFSALVMMTGMIAGPLFAGSMADWRGDYQLAFIIVGLLAGVGSVLFLAARKPAPPSAHDHLRR